MKTKRTYKTVDVEQLDLQLLLSLMTVGCIVAIDVAKTKMVAAFANAAGEVLQLVRFEHPAQTPFFLQRLVDLRNAKLEPRVVMEPTGTYGDALRHQCHVREIPVGMIPPKHTHDFAEVLDGVPSMHDAKAAVVLARLAAMKPPTAWVPDNDTKREMRARLDQRAPLSLTIALYHGHLEAMLARHWPEFGTHFDVHVSRSSLTLLQQFAGPEAVSAASSEAAATLRTASRKRYSNEFVAAVIQSARTTLGVPMVPAEQAKLCAIVTQIAHAQQQLDALDATLKEEVDKDEEMSSLARVVGPACAAALVGRLGSLREFKNAGAVEKALGLNLKERSSGETKGALHITKRGPGQVRQLLYLAVLRLIQSDPIVAAWYRGRKGYREEKGKQKAVVAVMRKIASALFHVARGATFDPTKLFDVRRLDLSAHAPDAKASDKTSPVASTDTSATRGASSTRKGARSQKPHSKGVNAQQRA